MKPTRLGFYPYGVMPIKASVSLGPARKLRNPRYTSFIDNDYWSLVETSHPYYENYMNQVI